MTSINHQATPRSLFELFLLHSPVPPRDVIIGKPTVKELDVKKEQITELVKSFEKVVEYLNSWVKIYGSCVTYTFFSIMCHIHLF